MKRPSIDERCTGKWYAQLYTSFWAHLLSSEMRNWTWDSNGKTKLVLSFLYPADGKMNKIKWLLTWPLIFVLFCTVPNCSKPRWEKWFMATFVLATLWIALFSYFMVWMVSAFSRTCHTEWSECLSLFCGCLRKACNCSHVFSVHTLNRYNSSFLLLFSAQIICPLLYRAQYSTGRCQLDFQENEDIHILLVKWILNGSFLTLSAETSSEIWLQGLILKRA